MAWWGETVSVRRASWTHSPADSSPKCHRTSKSCWSSRKSETLRSQSSTPCLKPTSRETSCSNSSRSWATATARWPASTKSSRDWTKFRPTRQSHEPPPFWEAWASRKICWKNQWDLSPEDGECEWLSLAPYSYNQKCFFWTNPQTT